MTDAVHEYPGTPLREADLAAGRVLTVPGAARAEYAWDLGIAMSHYLAELQQGRLVGRRCHHCGRVLFPPRMFCEHCFRPTTEWVTLSDTGTIQTFAICHIAWDASRIDEPKVPAVISIDGASRLMGLLHLIGGVSPDRVTVGQRVRAVWLPPPERRGAITDIRYFMPEEG
jgi:uncharacterized OB-fold protein